MTNREKLEDVYQDVACLLNNSLFYEIQEDKYPALVLKNIDTNEEYEIIIKKVK
jgi:hypothetical protein